MMNNDRCHHLLSGCHVAPSGVSKRRMGGSLCLLTWAGHDLITVVLHSGVVLVVVVGGW